MLAEAEPGEFGPVFGAKDAEATGKQTTLICGHFEYDRSGAHPLFGGLPQTISLSSSDDAHREWLATVSKLALVESQQSEQGSRAIVDRLAEVLLIQILRAHSQSQDTPGHFLAALHDPRLRRSLEAMHSEPARAWTPETLAATASMSRSKFAERFHDIVGLAPIQYLTQWRMLCARRQLRTAPHLSTAKIAEEVGYTSEWAFAKAFKRMFGVGPGAVRESTST